MVTVLNQGKLKPAEPHKPLVERAFELARSGRFRQIEDIERVLSKEGYPKASPHWNSGTLRKQLREACRKAAEAPGSVLPGETDRVEPSPVP